MQYSISCTRGPVSVIVYDVVIFLSVPGYDHVSPDSAVTVSTSNWHLFTKPLSLTNRYKQQNRELSCVTKV